MTESELKEALKGVNAAREAIYGMLDWDATKDGGEYWTDVVTRLDRITDTIEARLDGDTEKF